VSWELTHSLKRTGLAAWRALLAVAFGEDLTHAAAIAYYALLSLFPFLFLSMLLLGAVTADETSRGAVLTYVLRYVPAPLDFVSAQLDAFREMRLQIGVAGGLSLIWASLGVFTAVTGAVDQAWGVAQRRNFLKHRLASFLMLASAAGVLLVTLVIVTVVQMAQASWLGSVLGDLTVVRQLQAVVLKVLSTVLATVGAGVIFFAVPNATVRLRDVWLGAVLTGVLWRVAFELFSLVLRGNASLAYVHSSVTAVVAFLLWVYLSAVILLYGVEFTVAQAGLASRRLAPEPQAPESA